MSGKPRSELHAELEVRPDERLPFTAITSGEYSHYGVLGVVMADFDTVRQVHEEWLEIRSKAGWERYTQPWRERAKEISGASSFQELLGLRGYKLYDLPELWHEDNETNAYLRSARDETSYNRDEDPDAGR